MGVPSFFEYTCDRCGAPVCGRMQIMNLALDFVEELFCLACLASEQDMAEAELADFAKAYVYSRECFLTPWQNIQAATCPKIEQQQCFCQDRPVQEAL